MILELHVVYAEDENEDLGSAVRGLASVVAEQTGVVLVTVFDENGDVICEA